MTQIDELHSRITRALDRISTGVEILGTAPGAAAQGGESDEIEALRKALDDERMANAQLEERVRALHAQIENPPVEASAEKDADSDALAAQIDAQRGAMAALDEDLQRLRQANAALLASQQEMRGALEAGVGEPHLINQAMLAELEALRAARATEVSEAKALIAGLEPLLAGAASESQGEIQSEAEEQ
ncbi:hypothetical protein AYJ57_00630 [Salipiger sp. CCB-MM3]|uniref:hypothetical protein n=1 Tax=Salipiger sp. CCB-MM3 TaxID=1792508 RepID=UPI00080A9FEE|nr:hypothetical protein [Salipiger sp. CCB-MM3]ANT58994.1 hypothetical protein AYJ57_00630 [Salipiger sp. CCB-MM3]